MFVIISSTHYKPIIRSARDFDFNLVLMCFIVITALEFSMLNSWLGLGRWPAHTSRSNVIAIIIIIIKFYIKLKSVGIHDGVNVSETQIASKPHRMP